MAKLYERLNDESADDYKQFYVAPKIEEDKKSFPCQMCINKAHVVMLTEEGIIERTDASAIIHALLELERVGVEAVSINKNMEDLYTNTEAWLVDKLGESVGGRMHTARSRNDMYLTIARMLARQQINDVSLAVLRLAEALLEKADSHVYTVMPGFTHHSQHAQPITLAHFLLGALGSFIRDLQRLDDSFQCVNKSPMGAAAIATTGFAIKRERVAELLGFNGLIENSLDAIGGRDFQLQTVANYAICMSSLGRLAESLFTWNTREFGMVELADMYAGTSSIMPQKKNPVALETIKAEAIQVSSYLNTMFSILKGIPATNGVEPMYVDNWMTKSAVTTSAVLKIAANVVDTLKINKKVMERLTEEGFSTMTELADVIVRERGMAFRTAHKIVSHLVRNSIDKGIGCKAITREMVDDASLEVAGIALKLTNETIQRALDPTANVNLRKVRGGPSPSQVLASLAESKKEVEYWSKKVELRIRALEDSENRLRKICHSFN